MFLLRHFEQDVSRLRAVSTTGLRRRSVACAVDRCEQAGPWVRQPASVFFWTMRFGGAQFATLVVR